MILAPEEVYRLDYPHSLWRHSSHESIFGRNRSKLDGQDWAFHLIIDSCKIVKFYRPFDTSATPVQACA